MVCVITIIPDVFLEGVVSCVWYLVIVCSSVVICLRIVSYWTTPCLTSHIIHLRSVSSVVVVVVTVSWTVIIVGAVQLVVTSVIVSEITIVVIVWVIVPGRIIPTLISLIVLM